MANKNGVWSLCLLFLLYLSKEGMGQGAVVIRMDPRRVYQEGSFFIYTTSATENLQKHVVRRGEPIVLPAKSINTLVVQRF